jgi:16S rRNA (guanine(966)-N(2))-methyltransferase RsmD
MRVVSGIAKGKKLKAVPGDTTRPILDRVKTALFDILRPNIKDSIFLDCFAGTGQVGIEALSQGAKKSIFIDLEPKAISVIKENLSNCKLEEKAEVRNTDIFLYLKNTSKRFDIIFIAPPQYKDLWQETLLFISERPKLLNDNGLIVVQIDPKEYQEISMNTFKEVRQKKYGNSLIVFFEAD